MLKWSKSIQLFPDVNFVCYQHLDYSAVPTFSAVHVVSQVLCSPSFICPRLHAQSRRPHYSSACGETNSRVRGVENTVVLLQELLSDDGVDTRAAAIVDPGIVLA